MQEVHTEQAAVEAMYRRLDRDLADARDAYRQATAIRLKTRTTCTRGTLRSDA
ncbi:hypothetical protein SAMN02745244_00455 [Tessaracoccus bendigoensis DSM 12906]|uniref:Uncharacterized protein n=1 Tax=Tessaracoccus bendigoensis DSM 12906 TaxID=1123357 RepID=A0A1M6BJW7_9ACTN|nr:hypothetical protein SAMN02745244_00455 [Tessaracoccus bendigoensis DSM 12906]